MIPRSNHVHLIAGGRGTGKTTLAKLMAEKLEKNFPKQLTVDTFHNPLYHHLPVLERSKLSMWRKGKYFMFHSDPDELIQDLNENVRNTVIIFEDATKFIDKQLTKPMKALIVDSKQKNNDIFLLFHYLLAIPSDLIRIGSDYLHLFKTEEDFTSYYRSRFVNPAIEKTWNQVKDNPDFHFHKTIKLR